MTETDIVTTLLSSGGSSVVLAALGKYFITKTAKQFEAMKDDLTEIKTKMAIHEALRSEQKNAKEDIDRMKERLIILDSQVKAAWRRLDDK